MLEELWQEYRDQGVVFLGIAYIDVERNSLAYLEEHGISYPNAPDLQTVISSKYDISAIPETFFIGKNGDVEHIHSGVLNESRIRSLLELLLQSDG